jgi:uncharacterized protein YecE (DUF72 family)
MASQPRSKFWIGPSGWSYPDWDGVVYPSLRRRGFKPLAFIARFFNAVEVNSSFYRLPTPYMTARWLPQVPPDFRFAIKLTRTFTHERQEFPPPGDVDAFKQALVPLRAAGRLGPVLMQFPWSFRHTPDAVDWLKRLADAFPDFDRFIEVRHISWAQPEALALLRQVGGYTNIDQPLLRDCLGPTEHVLGDDAYVRLHGRNAANWFRDGQPAWARYDYLYSEEELREWVGRLNAIATRAHEVYVFANNHHRGQGPANALELRALLENRAVDVPAELARAFPRLRRIALPEREPGLFGEP